MILEPLFDKLHMRSFLLRIVVGSVVVALFVALGMVVVLQLLGIDVNPVLPAIVAAIAAAIYAAEARRSHRVRP